MAEKGYGYYCVGYDILFVHDLALGGHLRFNINSAEILDRVQLQLLRGV